MFKKAAIFSLIVSFCISNAAEFNQPASAAYPFGQLALQALQGLPKEIQGTILLLANANFNNANDINSIGEKLNQLRGLNHSFKTVIESAEFTQLWVNMVQLFHEQDSLKEHQQIRSLMPDTLAKSFMEYRKSAEFLKKRENEALLALHTDDAIDRYINYFLYAGEQTPQANEERMGAFQEWIRDILFALVRNPQESSSGRNALIRRVLQRKLVNLNQMYDQMRYGRGEPIVTTAIGSGLFKLADAMLAAGADINNTDVNGHTLFQTIFSYIEANEKIHPKQIEAINYLLSHHATMPVLNEKQIILLLNDAQITPELFAHLMSQTPTNPGYLANILEQRADQLTQEQYNGMLEKIAMYESLLAG